MMLTAIRRNEAACTKWGEFDEHLTKLEIPPTRMKGAEGQSHTHVVPLAPQISALLSRLSRHVVSPYVFTHTGARPAVSGFARYKQQLEQELARVGANVPAFRLHDFRRSFVMWAQEHDEDFNFDAGDIANRCLGHETFDKVKKTYNPYKFLKERRELLTTWANFLVNGETRKAAVPDVINEVVQAAELPPPTTVQAPPAPALGIERGAPLIDEGLAELRWGFFPTEIQAMRLTFDLLLAIIASPGVATGITDILRRTESAYLSTFREHGPLKSRMGPAVVMDLLHYATVGTLLSIEERQSGVLRPKSEYAKEAGRAIKRRLALAFRRDSGTIAAALANAMYGAAISRDSLRDRRRSGSKPEPLRGLETSARAVA
jgi:hypothetical protein